MTSPDTHAHFSTRYQGCRICTTGVLGENKAGWGAYSRSGLLIINMVVDGTLKILVLNRHFH